ncbi:MAG: SDR family oxidoreductase [Anaerolineae bacterium]|nr:SDR family oxidoreductase [Anaerolineae bacterium]
MTLSGKNILITGAAVRVGRALALAAAQAGANLILHFGQSIEAARETRAEVEALGVKAELVQADLAQPSEVKKLFDKALGFGDLHGLVNNAAIFEDLTLMESDLAAWERHLQINLTAPFLLSQAFGKALGPEKEGRIVNILDWRALRPGADHFPYTVSKAGLAGLTRSLAIALAPNIAVNGMALGAILPPSDGGNPNKVLQHVPAKRWANLDEARKTLLFLLEGPSYITGEIIHLDGGRHLI